MEIYLLSILSMAGIFAVLAISYDLSFGFAGMFSLAHGAFFGIGAYAGALAMLSFGAPFLLALVFGALVAGAVALLIAVPAGRLEGDYLIIGSLSFSAICYEAMVNMTSITNGPMGLRGIPHPTIFGIEFNTPYRMLLIILTVLAIVGFISYRVAFSPYGRVLRALKDDPVAVDASGKSVMLYKAQILTLSAALTGAAGTLYASYINFIDPESFAIRTSFIILVATVLGGAGTLWGPCLGALFLWIIPELLRFVGIPSAMRGSLNEIAYGLMLLGVVLLRPEGLIRKRELVTRPESVRSDVKTTA